MNRSRSSARFSLKKIVSLVISLGLLALIYWRIDFSRLLPVFAQADPPWVTLSLAMVVPLTLFTSWRLQQLVPDIGQLGFGEANKLILVASVLNLVLPSKMGDIAKAWFLRDRGHLDGALALSLVVFEKGCDMLSLLLWCAFGLLWVGLAATQTGRLFDLRAAEETSDAPGTIVSWVVAHATMLYSFCFIGVVVLLVLGVLLLASKKFAALFFQFARRWAPHKIAVKIEKLETSWSQMHGYFWSSRARLAKVVGASIFIWFLHLLQIWMFIVALKAWAPFVANLALSPLAILAGLLPLTFAGVGTRDAALVVCYAPYFDSATAAALGILCTARYLLPAIGGLPFAGGYIQRARDFAAHPAAASS